MKRGVLAKETPVELRIAERGCRECPALGLFLTRELRDEHTEKEHGWQSIPPICAGCGHEIWRVTDACVRTGDRAMRLIYHQRCLPKGGA